MNAPTMSSLLCRARRESEKDAPTVSSLLSSAVRESKEDMMRRRNAPTVSSILSNVLNEKTNVVASERVSEENVMENRRSKSKDIPVKMYETTQSTVPRNVDKDSRDMMKLMTESCSEENEMERIRNSLKIKMKDIREREQNTVPRNVIKEEDLMKLMSDLDNAKRGRSIRSCSDTVLDEENEMSPQSPSPIPSLPSVIQKNHQERGKKKKQRARSISEEEETLRNKRRDQEVERLRREHLERKRKVQEEQRRRRMKMNATIEMNRRQKAQRQHSNPADFTRGDVDDLMDNFVEQWTQCARRDWEIPLSFEKSDTDEKSSNIRLSYSERLRLAREKLRKMAARERSYCDDDIKKQKKDFEQRRRSRSSSPPGFARRRSSFSPDGEKKEAERICKLIETRVNLWAKNKSFLELISTVHTLLPRHCPDFSNESSPRRVVDAKELRRRYREVLRRVHPDKIGKREGDASPTVEELLMAQHAVSVLLSAKPKRKR